MRESLKVIYKMSIELKEVNYFFLISTEKTVEYKLLICQPYSYDSETLIDFKLVQFDNTSEVSNENTSF